MRKGRSRKEGRSKGPRAGVVACMKNCNEVGVAEPPHTGLGVGQELSWVTGGQIGFTGYYYFSFYPE